LTSLDPSRHTCLYASGIPPLLLQNRMRRFHSGHAGDEGGGWIWSTPEPSGNGQRICIAQLIFNIFFPAGNRAWATLGAQNRPVRPASANGRNVLSAKHLTQASVQLPSNTGRIRLWTRGLGPLEERFSCKESDTFSATKPVAAGFDASEQVPDLGAARAWTEDC